jgi:ABC-type branched-subunit amino acid transport system ATPase component
VSTPDPVLALSGVTLRYGGVAVLDDVALAVAAGEVVGLIGPNGAGKTSLLDVVAGVVAPNGGRVVVAGLDVTAWPTRRRHRHGLARTHQTPSVAGPDPVSEVALAAGAGRSVVAGAVRGLARADRTLAVALLESVGLAPARHRAPCRDLGLPDQRRVELARALARDPIVLMLDEPASGLPTAERERFITLVTGLAGPRRGVLLVEHDMDVVRRCAHRVVALDQGQVVAAGTFAAVTGHPRVRQAYLGDPAPPLEPSTAGAT